MLEPARNERPADATGIRFASLRCLRTAAHHRGQACRGALPESSRWDSHSHAGLNHQSWLYAFRDAGGKDITTRVLDAIPERTALGVDTAAIRDAGAVPVHYLKMFLHTTREVAAQRGVEPRGAALGRWSALVEEALLGGEADDARVDSLLTERRMDWFDEGVVPVLEGLHADQPHHMPLNVPADGAFSGAPPDAIVEVDCEISRHGVQAQAVPPLPSMPAALTRRLMDFERAALALPPRASAAQVAGTLSLHPLAPDRLQEVASELSRIKPEAFGLA